MKTTNLKVLTEKARADYRTDGFLLAKQVLPQDLLDDCQQVLEKWVDVMITRWMTEGMTHQAHRNLDFRTRYLTAWREAGKPHHERSPRKQLVQLDPQRMYRILKHPALLDVAQDLLGDDEIVSHGIWNSRPKAPDARFTDTPWHQDAQYFPEQARTHVLTVWFPLHAVDSTNSCLAVARGKHHSDLYEGDGDAGGTGFLGLKREDAAKLTPTPVAMEAGDALCFSEMMPHSAMPNTSDRMRWSMDTRFVTRAAAAPGALAQGLLARCPSDRSLETPYEEWLAKWPDGPGY